MKKILTAVVIYGLSSSLCAYTAAINQGAEQWDWDTCVTNLSNQCKLSCATSEERDCNETCMENATDKCISIGIFPPPGSGD